MIRPVDNSEVMTTDLKWLFKSPLSFPWSFHKEIPPFTFQLFPFWAILSVFPASLLPVAFILSLDWCHSYFLPPQPQCKDNYSATGIWLSNLPRVIKWEKETLSGQISIFERKHYQKFPKEKKTRMILKIALSKCRDNNIQKRF